LRLTYLTVWADDQSPLTIANTRLSLGKLARYGHSRMEEAALPVVMVA